MINDNQKECYFCSTPEKDHKYLLLETLFWKVYLANNQNYPGRCIIPLKRHCSSLSEITTQEMIEFHKIVKILEKIWAKELDATNFNWTCLMNGGYSEKPYNPHIHFHFIPRYDHPYTTASGEFVDKNFGNHYDLNDDTNSLSIEERITLCRYLKKIVFAEYNEYY